MQQESDSSGVPTGATGAKGYVWFVVGALLIMLGAVLWLALGWGAVLFFLLGGIGAVSLVAGYVVERSRTT
jgi:uncharacterized membrane protein